MLGNTEDTNCESPQLQIDDVVPSQPSTHPDSELLVFVYIYIYIYIYVCVCACVCVYVCVYVESMHIVSNQASSIYRGFDTLLFYIMLIALKAV